MRAGRFEALRHRPVLGIPAGIRAIPQFETVPAWRIARLRLTLRDAEQRGRDLADAGADLNHRALARRFALGRRRTEEEANRPVRRTTRKGRNFPLAKRAAIWRAIFATRPPNWAQGDRAAFGAIAEAHRLASAECAELGIAAPRYRTVYVLWHRGVAGADVMKVINRAALS